MSLNWNITNVKDYDSLSSNPYDDDKMNPVTDGLIWLTMAVDIGEITAKNADEFLWRADFTRTMDHGGRASFQCHDGENAIEVWLTIQDIRDHIGLATNVATLSRTKWLAKFARQRFAKRSNPNDESATVALRRHAKQFVNQNAKKTATK